MPGSESCVQADNIVHEQETTPGSKGYVQVNNIDMTRMYAQASVTADTKGLAWCSTRGMWVRHRPP
jgi:hypothetical protein